MWRRNTAVGEQESGEGSEMPVPPPQIPGGRGTRFRVPLTLGRGSPQPSRLPHMWRPQSQRAFPSSPGFYTGPTTDTDTSRTGEQSRAYARELGQRLSTRESDRLTVRDEARRSTYGPPGHSMNIKEDVIRLKMRGFDIAYPRGIMGRGAYGTVYRGTYGPEIQFLADNNDGVLPENVAPGLNFAAKMIDFDAVHENDPQNEWFVRASFEIEKQILTFADHENVVAIRAAINMGQPQEFMFGNQPYEQYQRVWLIMDLANQGTIDEYYMGNMDSIMTETLVRLSQDAFLGLQYLHHNNIVHGDVHAGNVLVFQDFQAGQPGQPPVVCAKWTDFGRGYYAPDHPPFWFFIDDPNFQELEQRKQVDCQYLCGILDDMWAVWRQDDEDFEVFAAGELMLELVETLRNNLDLDQTDMEHFEDGILMWNR